MVDIENFNLGVDEEDTEEFLEMVSENLEELQEHITEEEVREKKTSGEGKEENPQKI